jgi:hypothetical protein
LARGPVLVHLYRRRVRTSDRANLTLLLQLHQSMHGSRDRDRRVLPMGLEEVYAVRTQAFQTPLDFGRIASGARHLWTLI